MDDPGSIDEEDVALSAFNSFYDGIADGRFPRLEDRDDLWQVLLLLARQKAAGGAALFVVFSPDSSRLLTVDDSEKARVWNAVTGEPLSPPLPHRMQPGSARDVAKMLPSFSPDGRWALSVYNHGRSGPSSAYDQCSVHFWKAGSEFSTAPMRMALNQVIFSPDSTQVLAFGCSRTGWLLVRNAGQRGPVQESEAFQQGTCYLRVQRKSNILIGAFSADGSKWTELKPIDTSWPATVKVGLDGLNFSSQPFLVKFNDVNLQTKGAGSR